MMTPAAWTARKFSFDLPIETFPEVLERLRGTPARTAELMAGVPDNILAARTEAKWSAKENIGHLADLVPLEERRLQEFLSGASVLSPADTTNRATELANHNQRPVPQIVATFRQYRLEWVNKLEKLSESDLARTALHPRLQQAMRLLDWASFIADHDDHHLAAARYALASAVGKQ